MKGDKIVEEHLKGELPYSGWYREASREENCPDHLSLKVAGTINRSSLVKRYRIWIETVMLAAVVIALFIMFYMPSSDPVLDCPRETVIKPAE